MTTARPKIQSPLKVDPAVDALITQGAHFLGVTKEDLVAHAVRAYLSDRREQLAAGRREAIQGLDGTNRCRLALITGLTSAEMNEVGGVGE